MINPDNLRTLAAALTILDQQTGKLAPFSLNDEQVEILEALASSQRVCVLKGRQIGASTVCCLWALVHALTHEGQSVAIVADTQEKAQILLAKCASWAKQWAVPLEVENVTSIKLRNGAIIDAKSALSRSEGGESRVGRSKSYGMVIASELAYWSDDAATFTALTSTLLPGGQVVVESTASAADNLFRSIWFTADGWTKKFFAVETHAAYVADPNSISDDEWAELRSLYGFTSRPHAAWWSAKRATDFAGDSFRACREYPNRPDLAFSYAEGRWITRHLEVPTTQDGLWTRYEAEQEPCILSADVGSGSGGDHSAIAIVGRWTGNLHATWSSNTLDVHEFAQVILAAKLKHQPRAIIVEGNGIGAGLIAMLRAQKLEVCEHTSDAAEKSRRFSELRRDIESHALPVGPEVILEIKSSVVDRKGKYTGRDDLLSAISFARAWRERNPSSRPVPKPNPREQFVPQHKRNKRSPARNL